MAGKCPSCDKLVSNVRLEHVDANVMAGSTFHGAAFLCPWCNAILGVGIDPIAIKTDIVNETVAALKKAV